MCLVLGVQMKAEGRKPFGSALNASAPDDSDRTTSRCPTGGIAPYRFYVARPSSNLIIPATELPAYKLRNT